MAISFKGAHFPQDVMLMGVRWYLACPLSYRHVEELMEERGVLLDHATIQRWVVKYQCPVRRGVSSAQASSVAQLVDGRDGAPYRLYGGA
jgi:transposase-like protein